MYATFRAVNILLSDVEIRVLGSLVEKQTTTPDYYPLSLNALINACNQKSNRDPLMNLEEEAARRALHALNEKGLAGAVSSADSRVSKYEHRLQEVFNFDRRETAILCLLLLRGPQTLGELRGRSDRMHHFNDLSEVQSTLQRLMQREPPLVTALPRQPGAKESRYAHLLSANAELWAAPAASSAAVAGGAAEDDRLARLENQVGELQKEVADLRGQLAEFRRQFE